MRRLAAIASVALFASGLIGGVYVVWNGPGFGLCRDTLAKPIPILQPDKVVFRENDYIKWVEVESCVVDILSLSKDFNTNYSAATLKIGLFDRFWIRHDFLASLGGTTFGGGSVKLSYCSLEDNISVCSILTGVEVVSRLQKGDVVSVSVVYEDTRVDGWDQARITNTYGGLVLRQIKSLAEGNFIFSRTLGDFTVQVSEVRKLR